MAVNNRIITFFLIFTLSAVYVFIFGETGLIERLNLSRKADGFEIDIQELRLQNGSLSRELSRLKAGMYFDSELAGAGFVFAGSRLAVFEDEQYPSEKENEVVSETSINTMHLRIIWIVFSAIVVLLFLIRNPVRDGPDEDLR